MKKIRKIALTELQSLFYSPIAWFILIIFTVQSFIGFMDAIGSFLQNQEMNYAIGNLTMNIFGAQLGLSLFSEVAGYLYLYIPLLTMGLMSRELSSGSIKLLYSSPVTNLQIILGKYLSMMIYGLALLAILLIPMMYAAFTIENFDWPITLIGLIGVYLLICAYSAIGLFMSSLTSYQVVAGIGTLAVLALLNYVGRIGQNVDFIRDITYWLNMGSRANSFFIGLISSEDLLYFLLVIVMFLSLSILRLKAIRQKARGWVVWSKYLLVVIGIFMLGYVTSRPAMKSYYDSTRTKQLTLTPNSQEIIRQADGPMTITTYVNILADNFYFGLPGSRNYDKARFEQYMRFKPEIKLKYVYYYAKPDGSNLDQRFPGLTEEQIVGKIATATQIDSAMFKPVSTLAVKDMLEEEGYRFVRIIERGNGRKSHLRIYDDMMRHPSEREISAALKRAVADLPKVGFVSGHGERSMDMEGDRGYFRFAQERPFRFSLINQGFEVADVTLDRPIPEDINIILIADMRQAMTPEQEINLDAYIARGGNMVIAADVNRQESMNPLVGKVGVRFLPGQIVRRSGARDDSEGLGAASAKGAIPLFISNGKSKEDDYLPNFLVGNITEEGAGIAYGFREMYDRSSGVTMPGCVGIDYSTDKGFDVIPLLMSDAKDSWNEVETTNFIDDTVRINSAVGEIEQSLPMGIALSRSLDGRVQKIIVLGDADCISNGEIGMYRSKVNAANYDLIMSAFYWLSDEEVPVDVRRTPTTDNRLLTKTAGLKASKFWMIGVFPALLLIASLVIWLRRKGR